MFYFKRIISCLVLACFLNSTSFAAHNDLKKAAQMCAIGAITYLGGSNLESILGSVTELDLGNDLSTSLMIGGCQIIMEVGGLALFVNNASKLGSGLYKNFCDYCFGPNDEKKAEESKCSYYRPKHSKKIKRNNKRKNTSLSEAKIARKPFEIFPFFLGNYFGAILNASAVYTVLADGLSVTDAIILPCLAASLTNQLYGACYCIKNQERPGNMPIMNLLNAATFHYGLEPYLNLVVLANSTPVPAIFMVEGEEVSGFIIEKIHLLECLEFANGLMAPAMVVIGLGHITKKAFDYITKGGTCSSELLDCQNKTRPKIAEFILDARNKEPLNKVIKPQIKKRTKKLFYNKDNNPSYDYSFANASKTNKSNQFSFAKDKKVKTKGNISRKFQKLQKNRIELLEDQDTDDAFKLDENRQKILEQITDFRKDNSASVVEIKKLINSAKSLHKFTNSSTSGNMVTIEWQRPSGLSRTVKYEKNHKQKNEKASRWKGHKLNRVLDAVEVLVIDDLPEEFLQGYLEGRKLFNFKDFMYEVLFKREEQ